MIQFEYKGNYIDGDYWKLQLETVYKYADGVIIWSPKSHNIAKEWDENESWWIETKLFINSYPNINSK